MNTVAILSGQIDHSGAIFSTHEVSFIQKLNNQPFIWYPVMSILYLKCIQLFRPALNYTACLFVLELVQNSSP